MIDFHTHILPYMDDGAKDTDESIAMLKELKKQGVDTVVCSSHFYSMEDNPDSFLENQAKAYALLKESLTDDLPKIILGSEVQYFDGIAQCDTIDKLKISGSEYILLEMPSIKWNERIVREVITLHRKNPKIVIAHIERFLPLIPSGTIDEFIKEGIIIQSNASFFYGFFTRKKALKMLANGQIHLIGTDCHNMTSRAPDIKQAVDVIVKALGQHTVEKLDFWGRKVLSLE